MFLALQKFGHNLEPSHTLLSAFMDSRNYLNLTKLNICFKFQVSCTDLILNSPKYCFKYATSFEIGLSDYHHLIYSMLKTTHEKEESK